MGITLRELLELAGGMRDGPPAEVLDAGRLVHAAVHRRAPRRPAGLRGRRPRPGRCSAPRRCRSSTRRPAWCGRCCGGPSSTSTSPAASARRAARAPTGWCRSCDRLEARRGHRGGPRHAARHLRQHPRPVVLRARRRRDQPDHLVDPVLPRRVPRAPRATAAARSTRPRRRCSTRGSARHDRHDDRPARRRRPPRTWSPSPSTASRSACPRARW